VQKGKRDLYQAIMPIRGFLSGQAFEPEVVRQMSLALETICGKFGMELTEGPATRVVALKIIELAQRGVHRNDAKRTQALFAKRLKWPPTFGAVRLQCRQLGDIGRGPLHAFRV